MDQTFEILSVLRLITGSSHWSDLLHYCARREAPRVAAVRRTRGGSKRQRRFASAQIMAAAGRGVVQIHLTALVSLRRCRCTQSMG